MKNLFYILFVFQLICISCFEDDSNLDIQKLNPIVIENSAGFQGIISVTQMDTLRVEPLIYCEGVPDSELSFEWKLMNYGLIVPKVIDTTMYCCAQITEKSGLYTLKLTVTDRTTGIYQIETYSVDVKSGFSDGLLIADTKDNGVTSDLNLVKSKEFSEGWNYEDDNRYIVRDIWESVNGAPLDGAVLAVHTVGDGYHSLTVATTENVYRADSRDYIAEWTNEELFFVQPPFLGQEIRSAGIAYRMNANYEALMVNGLLYARSLQNNGKKYSYQMYPRGVADYDATMMLIPGVSWNLNPVYAYDALGKRMLFFYNENGYTAMDQRAGAFDVNDLSNYEALYLGNSKSGVILLVKNKEDGHYQALVMKDIMYYFNLNTTNDFAVGVYDVNNAQHLSQAKYYAFSLAADVMYYATESTVYAGPLDNMGSAVPQWTPRAGETITGIRMYDWTGGYYSIGSEEIIRSTDKLLLVTTQMANGEGKVTAIPILNQHVGQLEQNRKYQIELDGFGKILGIYKQKP